MNEPRSSLYEAIAQHDLANGAARRRLSSLSAVKLKALVDDLYEKIPRTAEPATSPYDFVSSSEMAGGPAPCGVLNCRAARLSELSAFAALYADSVVIPDPISLNSAFHPSAENLAHDLALLRQVKPLVDSGLVKFSDTTGHICPDCLATQLPGRCRSDIDRLYEVVESTLLANSSFRIAREDGELVFEWTGPTDLLRHGGIEYPIADMCQSKRAALAPLKPRKLDKHRLSSSGFLRSIFGHIQEDILMQNWYATAYGTSYLTSRHVDLTIIDQVGTPETSAVNGTIADAFRHVLPYLGDVRLETLLELRKNEGEAFSVYRDAMKRAFKDLKNPTAAQARELFGDVVLPELNGIDAAIRRSRSLLWPSLATSTVTAVASVGIGLYSGILPSGLGPMIAALGGIGAAFKAADKVREAVAVPPAARENRFYFLWRVKQASK